MEPAPPRTHREPWIFLVACVAVGLAFQGSRGLFETDEGRYAECAREMVATGDWLVPLLQGVPHLTKPPGAYWLIAAGLEAFGRNEWGARAFLGIALALSAICVRTIGRVLLDDAGGARAGWCYLAMAYPFAAGSILTTDTFLAAGVLGALACAASALRAARPAPWFVGAAACLAIAAFVKGHLALVPWVTFAAGFLLVRDRPPWRWWMGVAAATVVGVLAGFAWFWWAAANVPGAEEHFRREIAMRLEGTGDHAPRPWWFYFEVLAAGTCPWWIQIVRGVRSVTWRRRAADPADHSRDPVGAHPRPGPTLAPPRARGQVPGASGPDDAARVLLFWAAATFLVFQIVPAKMPLYVLPVAAPLALWAARGTREPGSPWPARPWILGVWIAFLLGVRWYAATLHEDPRDMRRLAAAVVRADPTGTAPVSVYMGADVQGLDFYLDGRPQRVRTRQVWTRRSTVRAHNAAARRAARGETWLLVVEDHEGTDAEVAAIAGSTAHLAEAIPGYRVYRIVPAPR